ncbi:hypothetical protein BKA69DRAFT_208948 [Paraphysoderma sedebokerense]|nr:hypothetical protein BKA69DRAFT_208948 [Paraphysoderma sedebokerense]
MVTYTSCLEKKIRKLPQIQLSSKVAYTQSQSNIQIDWTAIDKTVFEFHSVMDHIRMKDLFSKEVHEYLKVTRHFDQESSSPTLENCDTKGLRSQLKSWHDQKSILSNSLQQQEKKLELDWEHIQKDARKLASLQLSLLDEISNPQDPVHIIDVEKLVRAKAAYITAKEIWRCHKTKVEGYTKEIEECLIRTRGAMESVLRDVDAESIKFTQAFQESINSFIISLDFLRKSLAEAAKDVHHRLQLCQYRDPELHRELKVLSHDLERIFETENVIEQLIVVLNGKKQNGISENVGLHKRTSEGAERPQFEATVHPEGNDAEPPQSEIISSNGEIKDSSSTGTIDSSVDDWRLL